MDLMAIPAARRVLLVAWMYAVLVAWASVAAPAAMAFSDWARTSSDGRLETTALWLVRAGAALFVWFGASTAARKGLSAASTLAVTSGALMGVLVGEAGASFVASHWGEAINRTLASLDLPQDAGFDDLPIVISLGGYGAGVLLASFVGNRPARHSSLGSEHAVEQ